MATETCIDAHRFVPRLSAFQTIFGFVWLALMIGAIPKFLERFAEFRQP